MGGVADLHYPGGHVGERWLVVPSGGAFRFPCGSLNISFLLEDAPAAAELPRRLRGALGRLWSGSGWCAVALYIMGSTGVIVLSVLTSRPCAP